MLWLKVGTDRFPLREGETTLGRSQYCTVIIPSQAASREHALLIRRREEIVLKDLGSRNGTALNGRRIQGPERIVVGDVITLGSCEVQLIAGTAISDDMIHTVEKQLPDDFRGSRETVPEMTQTVPPTVGPDEE